MNTNEYYIKRCIELAKNGLGTTYPNPLVGSIIVYKGKIIGEGWHIRAGDEHAEVRAINSVKNQDLLKKSTIYVTLEPCSHFGKTPPCSDLIIEKKIPKIVIGTVDPFAKVAGRGIEKLFLAGRQVTVGVCENECEDLNKRFFTFHRKKRPYVILKWAQTKHGFIAPPDQIVGDIIWISNAYSKQLVHKWRAEEESILVGTNTAIKDNPQLNTRLWKGENPVRVVIDQDLKIPKTHHIFDQSVKTIVFHSKNFKPIDDTNLIFEALDFESKIPTQILEKLHQHNLQSVIIEGGGVTLQNFINEDLWDEARVFTGENAIEIGIKAPILNKNPHSEIQIENDQLNYFYND
ncbi:bifunctional diaminohydroxyphosphoribosylaminopyrimidine deaminase/5-amino-6-(5-phosphoribosylamino)uracil reductase RibD [Psychroflexus aestuariivivens]|uniref:bifunctional diaminohydroxyphosphoribosylaminopyrimidine deaminase/5-amino-6-(5-phosphoribosylamino)uracil reductase RibD n=1 Tax=Psychroflexus aestuariivivens TaxID=1795040 RepID=UPI000FD901FD|nr:bifunctional diaminohydroxyphosphoribosylaminopyrimidine deaminase/5-amino-6-(5-phosphoribosylamino)uracil reductase RibD [Psychroflexus aestuariivivens]